MSPNFSQVDIICLKRQSVTGSLVSVFICFRGLKFKLLRCSKKERTLNIWQLVETYSLQSDHLFFFMKLLFSSDENLNLAV